MIAGPFFCVGEVGITISLRESWTVSPEPVEGCFQTISVVRQGAIAIQHGMLNIR
jgi:hypothetical protein